jgi:hypothetical protein
MYGRPSRPLPWLPWLPPFLFGGQMLPILCACQLALRLPLGIFLFLVSGLLAFFGGFEDCSA